MRTSRFWLFAVCLAFAGGIAGAQTQPKELTWALGEFDGAGDWRSRLPLLLVHGWDALPDHKLSDAERSLLKSRFIEAAARTLDQQAAKLQLDLDRKRLGTLPAGEPEASRKALAALTAKADVLRQSDPPGSEAPTRLAFKPLWPTGRDKLPWAVTDAAALARQSQAVYTVTGSFRTVGGYLAATVTLTSSWERRVLAQWQGQFAPDEAPERMAEASDRLREALLGRAWAGLAITAPVPGTRVRVAGAWHLLPWSTDDLEPGPLDVVVQEPGHPEVLQTVALTSGERVPLPWEPGLTVRTSLVLETDPPGALLYLDSRYLGPSPQTVDRPLATSRVRAQAEGWETAAWEVGPQTPSPSRFTLRQPRPVVSVPAAKDAFYLSLAAFSASLTATAFAGAWQSEQVQLVNAYALAGSQSGYDTALVRYHAVSVGYGLSIALTSGLFVWMMVELGDYLGVAQASLP